MAVTKDLLLKAGTVLLPFPGTSRDRSAVCLCCDTKKIPARIVRDKANTFPNVDILETNSSTLSPNRLMINRTSIKRIKPTVTKAKLLVSIPKICRTVFTTPVAITPQAILAETNRVIPI